jgi:hypothetical protein
MRSDESVSQSINSEGSDLWKPVVKQRLILFGQAHLSRNGGRSGRSVRGISVDEHTFKFPEPFEAAKIVDFGTFTARF